MKQALLVRQRGLPIHVWVPDSAQLGESVRWNGARWTVSRFYSTRLSMGDRAQRAIRCWSNSLQGWDPVRDATDTRLEG